MQGGNIPSIKLENCSVYNPTLHIFPHLIKICKVGLLYTEHFIHSSLPCFPACSLLICYPYISIHFLMLFSLISYTSVKWYKNRVCVPQVALWQENSRCGVPVESSESDFRSDSRSLGYQIGMILTVRDSGNVGRFSGNCCGPSVTQEIPKKRWGQFLEKGTGDSAPIGTSVSNSFPEPIDRFDITIFTLNYCWTTARPVDQRS